MSESSSSGDKKVTIFLVGSSHGAKDGDRRQVDEARAAELVRAGLARYPAAKSS